ncbi:MAG: phenylalanine--tRNA ligase subunit beta [Acidimicrobiaceae bacterium]|nr:phenylalanine--tRNA ligase subunit beta [Acidimicrobiaceae bacterium]MBA52794.1 phenylalanine--tRNA ligase subunit beta [Acidimicrobiaceae bacterium]|tara:strand:- start:11920 stop:14292 length:2373 start_codon:yes stop_codon:yes gene_type:complete
MKVLLSWLREFAPIEGDPYELADHMSDLGMAVEETRILNPLEGVVVARVADLRPHPKADRIQLVDVEIENGDPMQVCCGAFNMSVGDLIPFATIGTVMPDGMEISQREMRGEMSNGMCCSAAELGLGSDHDGIMILPEHLETGAPLMQELGLVGDILWDLEINPNRPDAMSVAGVARDLAARLDVPFEIPEWTVPSSGAAEDLASIQIDDGVLCPRFTGRVLRGVTVGKSPLWMQMRLTLLGMRPINSVVDVSNYVMLELGTPNHTYDLSLLPNGHIGVRRASDGESITTLDDQERMLQPNDGLIVNEADEPIGIAGVMGGASTEISDTTDSVLVELACWEPRSIARTSQRLGLRSEASARFERGTDWQINVTAVQRFCHLLNEVTPGGIEIVGEVLDVAGTTPDSISVPVRTSRISMLLGRDFSSEEIRNLLTPIGFDVENTDSQDVQLVTIPSFRPDTETETDIAEEVARHYGYGKLGATVPRSPDAGHLSPQQKLRRVIRQVMTGAGLIEAMPNPFLAPDDITKAALIVEEPVRLLNPLAVEESVLRPSLLPGLLTAVAYNYSHRNMGAKLFETGPVFEASEDSSGLPLETEHLAALISNADAFAATSLLKDLASTLKLEFQLTNVDGLAGLHPTRGAKINIGDTEVGSLGEVDPAVLRSYEIEDRCAWLNLRLDLVIEAAISVEGVSYQPVSTFPSSDVDLAFAVGEQVQASEIEMTLRKAAGEELQSLHLFDVFRSGQLDEGVRSLAFSMRLQAKDKTLTDEEVGVVRQRCIEAVESAHPASLRA